MLVFNFNFYPFIACAYGISLSLKNSFIICNTVLTLQELFEQSEIQEILYKHATKKESIRPG